MLPNQTHPVPGNQVWILRNMARTHRETHFKVFTRIRYHDQRAPGPEEAMTSSSSRCKCNTFIHQGRGEHMWSSPTDIWPNWRKYSDLTGQFTVQSERGNTYILVAYHYDANNILTTPLKNITGPWILNGITKIHYKLRKRGLTPKLHIMDNNVSEDLKQYFDDSDIQFQLVPPQTNQRNSAERAVRTFKNHFIAALFTVDHISPFYLWDHILPQVTMTLNMLQQLPTKPWTISLWTGRRNPTFWTNTIITIGMQGANSWKTS